MGLWLSFLYTDVLKLKEKKKLHQQMYLYSQIYLYILVGINGWRVFLNALQILCHLGLWPPKRSSTGRHQKVRVAFCGGALGSAALPEGSKSVVKSMNVPT